MQISSPAFEAGGEIPTRFTCEGQNISPPLDWDLLPEGTRSLALLVDDPDVPSDEPFSHWVLYNIPIDWRGLPEDFQPGADWPGERGRNSQGSTRYEGPCPPFGDPHHYYFRLYAVDEPLNLGEGATRAQVIDALHGHILEETDMFGTYVRSGASINPQA
jgi:Raf kinase inhibitor-like YbhB/YbcL family protein